MQNDPSDRLLSAFDGLKNIVGSGNTAAPGSEIFGDYLRDETYLRGDACLVLRPGNRAEVAALLTEIKMLRAVFPAEHRHLGLTLRGGGSGLSGAAVPDGGVVLDLTRLDRIAEIDEQNLFARVECGARLSEIEAALSDKPFYYAVDPSSLALCTLGGSIATNAAGPSSLKYGTTRQNLAAVRFLSATGEIIAAGALPTKTSMGFSLTDLMCGSEGRLGIILEADIRLVPRREEVQLLVGSFKDESAAIGFIVTLRRIGIRPKCLEIIDAYSISLVDFPVRGGAVLMIELDGNVAEVAADLERLTTIPGAGEWVVARDGKSQANLWAKRQSITSELKRRFAFKLGEDIAVPLSALAATTAFARRQAAARGVRTAIWGHAGDGNLHVNYLLERAEDLPVLDTLMKELAQHVTRVGGAISGEHGLGRLKKKIAREVLPPAYFEIQERIKHAFDPGHIFNPALEAE